MNSIKDYNEALNILFGTQNEVLKKREFNLLKEILDKTGYDHALLLTDDEFDKLVNILLKGRHAKEKKILE